MRLYFRRRSDVLEDDTEVTPAYDVGLRNAAGDNYAETRRPRTLSNHDILCRFIINNSNKLHISKVIYIIIQCNMTID